MSALDQFAQHKAAASRTMHHNASARERELREEWGRILDEAENIISVARKEHRDLTTAENASVETLMARASDKRRQVEAAAGEWRDSVEHRLSAQTGDGGDRRHGTPWRDQHGNPVYMLSKAQRWSDLPIKDGLNDPEASLGECIRCLITGDRRHASPGVRAALSEGANSGGGFLVPDELMRRLVDAARARSVIMRAGAMTVPMASDSMTLARVATDPTFESKSENAAFTGSDITFDALNFTAHTVGTYVTASRELAADAPNFSDAVEGTLVRAFATKLDNIAINGMSNRPDGILDWATTTGLTETGSVGAITWENLATGVSTIQADNHEPNAYVVHPTIAGDLAVLTSGDGTNSAKLWLGPPPNVAPLTQFVTTNIDTGNIVIGDFSQFVFAVRQGAMVEVSREAGDAFAKHQVLVKLTWRGDTGAFRYDAFHRLTGITT